jgi:hypothetical protein
MFKDRNELKEPTSVELRRVAETRDRFVREPSSNSSDVGVFLITSLRASHFR